MSEKKAIELVEEMLVNISIAKEHYERNAKDDISHILNAYYKDLRKLQKVLEK